MQVHMTQDTHTYTHTHTWYAAWQHPTTARLTTFHVCKSRGCLCSFGLLMMGGVSPEICWASFKIRNNKILITLLHLVGIFTVRRQWTLNQTQLKFLAIRKNTLQCFSLFFSSQINTDLLILFNLIYLLSLNFNKSIYITDWINMWPHDRTVLTFKNPASYI